MLCSRSTMRFDGKFQDIYAQEMAISVFVAIIFQPNIIWITDIGKATQINNFKIFFFGFLNQLN